MAVGVLVAVEVAVEVAVWVGLLVGVSVGAAMLKILPAAGKPPVIVPVWPVACPWAPTAVALVISTS